MLQNLLTRKAFYFLVAAFLFLAGQTKAQVFWTENFSVPAWTLNVPTGLNDPDANYFDISDGEGGGIPPNLGAPGSCGVALNGNNTLFVTSTFAAGGAAYNSGGFCGLGICVTTNKRAESPTINCSGKINITLDFNYIENGDGLIDDAVLYYYDGLTWSVIGNMPKTLTGCGFQGLWTSYSIMLPATANNNPNVKIGFGWTNNDDGLGTDPSFAVDDITLSAPVGGGLSTDALAVLNYCSCDNLNVGFFTNAAIAAGNVYTAQLSDAFGNFAAPVAIGTLPSVATSGSIACTIPCNTPNGSNYRIRVISSNPPINGSDNGADITISVTPAPSINNTTVNCITTLSALANVPGGPFTYLWQPGGAVTQNINAAASGIYTVTVSNNGCSATATLNVVVTPPPTVTANANPASVCPGGTTILTGGGNALTYSWSGGVVDGVAFAPAATGTYTVTGTNAAGCTATSTVTVTVNPNLTITINATSPGVCPGGADTLTASGASSYVWLPGGQTGATLIVSPAVTTTYTVTGSNGPNCSGTTTFTVNVGGIQSLVITMTGPPCNDTLTALAVATGGGGVTPGDKYYITDQVPWGQPDNVNHMNAIFGAGNWIQANFSTPAATVYVPGTQFVYIDGSDGNGTACTNYINANIAVIEAWVNAGGRLFLNAAPNNGGIQTWGFGGTTLNYQNLIPNAINAVPGTVVTNLAHPINLGPYLPVDPSGFYTGNYYAHADVVNGGTTVMHDPSNPAIAVCAEKVWGTGLVFFGGMTTTFYHNNVGPLVNQHAVNIRRNIIFYVAGSPLPAPPITYTWQPGNVSGPVLVPPASGIYTVTASVNGCTSTATFNFTLNTPPVMTATASPASICPGGNVVMQATGATSYLWQPGGLTGPTQNINPFATTTYTITGTSAAGCTSSTTLTVTVTTNLPVTATATPNTICAGASVALSSTGAVTYVWTPGNLNGPNQTVTPAVTTTYTVNGSDPNGCVGTATVLVSVVQPPIVTITQAPAGPVCIGDPITLTANGALSFIWTGGIVNGASFYPVATTTYTVTGSNNNGCNSTASITVTAVTPQAPNVNIVSSPAPIYVGQFASISAIVPAYIPNYILNWYRGNSYYTTTVGPANSISYIPNAMSDSVYAYLVPTGCYDPDSVRSNAIAPRTPLSLNDVEAPEGFVMYPNPAHHLIQIDGTIAGDEMVLTDVLGQTILRKTFKDSKIESIQIDALANGIYYAKFVRQQKSWVVKVTKE
jgi:hypothetical protein